MMEQTVEIDWLEAHSENYFGDGGFDLHVLSELRERYPIALHGIGLAPGSATGISSVHLLKLQRLVERIEPLFVSEHISWGAAHGFVLNELLPLPFTHDALGIVCSNISYIQDVLRRNILIENVSAYVRFKEADYSEVEFINAISDRTGCGILLDVNNLYVNQCNHGDDAISFLDTVDRKSVREIHLAGHVQNEFEVVDNHGTCVAPEVWRLYEYALLKCGRVSTLIEWDTDVPQLDVLLGQAAKARVIHARAEPTND